MKVKSFEEFISMKEQGQGRNFGSEEEASAARRELFASAGPDEFADNLDDDFADAQPPQPPQMQQSQEMQMIERAVSLARQKSSGDWITEFLQQAITYLGEILDDEESIPSGPLGPANGEMI